MKRFYSRSIFLLSAEADLAVLANVNASHGIIPMLNLNQNTTFQSDDRISL